MKRMIVECFVRELTVKKKKRIFFSFRPGKVCKFGVERSE